ncbi:unnamed protein product [Acanthoscelides obtectus]|uniref:Cyclic nucleotide-binding domain-containing protein n=1 Tax=Acanthoscelides obtectus TaxID=200917 RepID=A0A9P0K6W1_ACAOB|nr:unnamed protein product [Acanthoscelides obtectus]CAK1626802.1 Potassium/sodium hyperpolarization-activated cyclic nucleotide-gated channel 4 [Acanthoscelides obtectus]
MRFVAPRTRRYQSTHQLRPIHLLEKKSPASHATQQRTSLFQNLLQIVHPKEDGANQTSNAIQKKNTSFQCVEHLLGIFDSLDVRYRSLCKNYIVFAVDMLARFYFGYYDCETNKTVLNWKGIAKHYVETYFIFDFLAGSHTLLYGMKYISASLSSVHGWLVFFAVFRVIRIPRIMDAYNIFRLRVSASTFTNTLLRSLIMLTIISTFSYCMFFTAEDAVEGFFYGTMRYDLFNIHRIYTATLQTFAVALFGQVEGAQLAIEMVSITFLIYGFWINTLTLVILLHMWRKFPLSRTEEAYQEFKQFVKYQTLPPELRIKFFMYLKYKFKHRYYREATIEKSVSSILRRELHVTWHMQRIGFFGKIPTRMLNNLVARFRTEIFLTNDVIIVAGVPGDCMYFINYGTVAIYSLAGNEVCHLEDGAYFGEIAMIFDELRVETVVAVAPCELFILNRSDFVEIIHPYPRVLEEIRQQARKKISATGLESVEPPKKQRSNSSIL